MHWRLANCLYDPRVQHPSAVAGDLKIHNPRRNEKVYICSLRTNRRVVIQSLQFLSWWLHCQIQLEGDSTRKETWLLEVFTQEGFQTLILLLTGVKVPCNKGRHCPFHKSQLDSLTFGVAGSTGLWTRYYSKCLVIVALKLKELKVS